MDPLQSSLFSGVEEMVKVQMAKGESPEYYFGYLTMFPENKWFSTSNNVNNPLPNQYDIMQDFAHAGLIESRTYPIYIGKEMKGVQSYFRYNFNLIYKEPKI